MFLLRLEGAYQKKLPKYKVEMKKDQSLKTAATVITEYENNVLLAGSIDEKSDWILNSGSAYHLYGDKEMFSTYAPCNDGLVWMMNNITSIVVGKGSV